MTNTEALVLLDVSNRIATITLNRPEKRNALNPDVVEQLKLAFKKIEANDEVKVVVLKANGEAFCAGADLAYLQQLQQNTFDENLADSNHLKELFELIYHFPKIIIAQIEGHALAGGCGLAVVCDFSFSVPEAKFGFTEVKIGFIPAIVMIFLLRKVNESIAKELLLTGDLINANDAARFNLINKVIDKTEMNDFVQSFCKKLIEQASGESLKITKQMIANVQSMNIAEALNFAAEQNAKARSTSDCKKGILAFINKEKLTW